MRYVSAGIDNLGLSHSITPDEGKALQNACNLRWKDGGFVLLASADMPLIILYFFPGKVIADVNVPKLAYGHNVRLAGPEQVRNAIRILTQNTERVAPRLNWDQALVSHLHVTFTVEVVDFEACAALCKAPRGYWPYQFDNGNGYHNAKTKNLPVNWYEKREHLQIEGIPFPIEIILEMGSPENLLFRFEARLNQSVLAELKKHGGWNGLSILAEDLFGAGFNSAMTYLKWRFDRHVPIPIDRTPAIHSGMSKRKFAALNTRRTANENTERMREQARDYHKAGHISSEMLDAELERIGALECRALAVSLHSALENEVEQTGKIVVIVNGNLKEAEFEHAPRTHGHTNAV